MCLGLHINEIGILDVTLHACLCITYMSIYINKLIYLMLLYIHACMLVYVHMYKVHMYLGLHTNKICLMLLYMYACMYAQLQVSLVF
jgi:hypothetical protein